MHVAAVAPLAPEVGLGLAALGSLIAFCISWGLLHSWNRTFGALFDSIANVRIPTGIGGGIHPLRVVGRLNDKIRTGLGWAVARSERYMSFFANQLAQSVTSLAHFIEHLPDAIVAALHGTSVTIINKAKALTAAQWAQIRRLPALIRRIDHLNSYIEARVHHAIAVALGASTHALSTAIAGAGHLGELAWRRTERQARRLTRLEKLLVGAGLATLGLRLLSRLRLGWLRCSNVNKVGRRLCGLDPSLLETLLADALLIVGTVSLVELARELQDVTEETSGWVRWFWRVSSDKPTSTPG